MKGIIFNLLEEIITREAGEDAWENLLDANRLSGAYTSLGSYPDAELLQLVSGVAQTLQMPPEGVVRWFGRKALPLLAARYPEFFRSNRTARSFLLTLNDIIHPEVRKLYPGADVPDFTYEASSPHALVMVYQSSRKMCALAEGLIEGAAAQYQEEVTLAQVECMHRGDSRCVFQISFHGREDQDHE